MKTIKILLALFALCVGAQISAQTYAYKNVYWVKDGVKSKGNNRITYITFVDNKRRCYKSDKNGMNLYPNNPSFIYKYKGTENGMHIYYSSEHPSLPLNREGFDKMYFSQDFKRMNEEFALMMSIQGIGVYQYVENPLKEQAPKQLY